MDSLLPQSIQDESNLALEQCFKQALNIDLAKFLLYPTENCSDTVINALARENHVLGCEGLNYASTKEEKCALINGSFNLHLTKGTLESIKNACLHLNFDFELEDFSKYGGRPAHFRVSYLNLNNKSYDETLHKEVKELINCYKSATRKLDTINYFLCSKAVLYTFLRCKTIEKTVIRTKEIIL